jgi:hypothetical protein
MWGRNLTKQGQSCQELLMLLQIEGISGHRPVILIRINAFNTAD